MWYVGGCKISKFENLLQYDYRDFSVKSFESERAKIISINVNF